MNPGVQTTLLIIVLLILALSGWGTKTIEDANGRLCTVVLFLFGYALAISWEVSTAGGWQANLGGVLMPVALMAWALLHTGSWSYRLQWVMGVLTVASVVVVLMSLVPLDPAFFPLDGVYLYPAIAALVSVISVKRPFAALSIAVIGVALAAFVDPLIHDRMDKGSVVFGGAEMRDLMSYTACGVLFTHGLYQAAARYAVSLFKALFGGREGGPEHV